MVSSDAYVPDLISDEELSEFDSHGERMGWGDTPAILVVDIIEGGTASGQPDVMRANKRLLEVARNNDVPVILIKPAKKRYVDDDFRGHYDEKSTSPSTTPSEVHPDLLTDEDTILGKPRPSAFYSTPLADILQYHGVDTVIVTGATTSGCVRATATDANAGNYFTIIPEECVADRCETSHQVSLFDMDMKYADVTPLEEVLEKLEVKATAVAD
jgi:nicotinamidase-related amidase